MSERDGYEPGVPCWVTTIQPDPSAAAAFYGELFGWRPAPEDNYFIAHLDGREVAAIAPLPPGVSPAPAPTWVTHVSVSSADEAADRAISAGGRVVAGPLDFPTGRSTVL